MASLDKTETLAIAFKNRGEAPHRFDGDRFYSYYKNFTQHLTAKKTFYKLVAISKAINYS